MTGVKETNTSLLCISINGSNISVSWIRSMGWVHWKQSVREREVRYLAADVPQDLFQKQETFLFKCMSTSWTLHKTRERSAFSPVSALTTPSSLLPSSDSERLHRQTADTAKATETAACSRDVRLRSTKYKRDTASIQWEEGREGKGREVCS